MKRVAWWVLEAVLIVVAVAAMVLTMLPKLTGE